MGAGTSGGAAACVTGNDDGARWAATRASLLSAASMARAESVGVARMWSAWAWSAWRGRFWLGFGCGFGALLGSVWMRLWEGPKGNFLSARALLACPGEQFQ